MTREFLEKNKLKVVIRAHSVIPEGYMWVHNDKLLSLFSSGAYYKGVNPHYLQITDKQEYILYGLKNNK